MGDPGTLEGPVRVFVGSTYEDLRSHRDAVLMALAAMQHTGWGMEFFGARPGSPKDECLQRVRECDAYVGIFPMRYRCVDEGTGQGGAKRLTKH